MDENQAAKLLSVSLNHSQDEIRRAYINSKQKLELSIKNAGSASIKSAYEDALNELNSAYSILANRTNQGSATAKSFKVAGIIFGLFSLLLFLSVVTIFLVRSNDNQRNLILLSGNLISIAVYAVCSFYLFRNKAWAYFVGTALFLIHTLFFIRSLNFELFSSDGVTSVEKISLIVPLVIRLSIISFLLFQLNKFLPDNNQKKTIQYSSISIVALMILVLFSVKIAGINDSADNLEDDYTRESYEWEAQSTLNVIEEFYVVGQSARDLIQDYQREAEEIYDSRGGYNARNYVELIVNFEHDASNELDMLYTYSQDAVACFKRIEATDDNESDLMQMQQLEQLAQQTLEAIQQMKQQTAQTLEELRSSY